MDKENVQVLIKSPVGKWLEFKTFKSWEEFERFVHTFYIKANQGYTFEFSIFK